MAAVDGYRNQADACRRLAETEAEHADRSAWLFLENAFMRLSDDASRLAPTSAPKLTVVTSKKVKGRKRR